MEAFMNMPEEAITPEDGQLVALRADAAQLIESIGSLVVQKKDIEAKEKAMRKQLIAAMEKYRVKSFDSDAVKFVYIEPSTKTTVDISQLRADKPELVKQYEKVSPVSASVKITVK